MIPNVFPISETEVPGTTYKLKGKCWSRFQLPLVAGHGRTGHSCQGLTSHFEITVASYAVLLGCLGRFAPLSSLVSSLRDVMKNNRHFGGKAVLFMGDFKQLLPVVRFGTGQNNTTHKCS